MKMYDFEYVLPWVRENQILEKSLSGSTYDRTTYIIFYLTLSVICCIPNVFLILLIARHGLHHRNLLFAMLHWSLANMGSIIVLLSFVVEVKIDDSPLSPSDIGYTWIQTMDAIFRIVPVIISIFLIFDRFIKSINCRCIVYSIWGMFCCMLLVAASCFAGGTGHGFYVILAYIFLILKVQAIFLLIVKTVAHFILYTDEELYKLRTVLASIYMVSNLCQWFWNRMYNYPDVFSGLSIVLDVLFYGNGFINVVLLMCYDKDVKTLLRVRGLSNKSTIP